MRRLCFGVLVFVLASPPALAAGECKVGLTRQDLEDGERHFKLDADSPALLSFSPDGERTGEFRGLICDENGDVFQKNISMRLVRYKADSSIKRSKLKRIDFETGGRATIIDARQLLSSDDGRFAATGLVAGEWAILVEWTNISARDHRYVRLHLRVNNDAGIGVEPGYGTTVAMFGKRDTSEPE